GCNGLNVLSVDVPSHEVAGKPVKLTCNYDLEGDVLYSVKWYRGSSEFFRYIPGDHPPIQVYDLPGVVVDSAVSDDRTVSLRPVTLDSSGSYKCEVSADMPSFHTDSESANMLVV
ncbi:Immunoglobulin-like domain, partial [Trinorchestia longiramus]